MAIIISQDLYITTLLIAIAIIVAATTLAYDLGGKGKIKAARHQAEEFRKLSATVQTSFKSEGGKQYSRGYLEGYQACQDNVYNFLEQGVTSEVQ